MGWERRYDEVKDALREIRAPLNRPRTSNENFLAATRMLSKNLFRYFFSDGPLRLEIRFSPRAEIKQCKQAIGRSCISAKSFAIEIILSILISKQVLGIS